MKILLTDKLDKSQKNETQLADNNPSESIYANFHFEDYYLYDCRE